MSGKDGSSASTSNEAGKAGRAGQNRQERLAREAKALRENLLRRKQQKRNRPAGFSMLVSIASDGRVSGDEGDPRQ